MARELGGRRGARGESGNTWSFGQPLRLGGEAESKGPPELGLCRSRGGLASQGAEHVYISIQIRRGSIPHTHQYL